MSEALFYANALEVSDKNPALINVNNRAAAELRRLHAELERKSDAIQRLWKERDELRTLNAELVEALRDLEWAASGVEYMESEYANELSKARAALAKVGESK